VKVSRRQAVGVAVLAAATALIISSTGSANRQATFKAAIVTDTAGLNDRSFNHLANLGRLKAQKELGISTRAFISKTTSDYLPNLAAAGTQGFNAAVANGYKLADAVDTAAQRFTNTKFAIVDFPWVALKHKPKNAYGLTFKSEQSGFLVGYLAGLMTKKEGGKQVVSTVGGEDLDSVENWMAGYRAGAKKANPGIKVLVDFSGAFPPSAAPKCKSLALKQIAQGSHAIFQVAGGCGLGVIDAAKEKKVWAIGVDADQAYLAPGTILTSGVKRVDLAVYGFFKAVKNNTLKAGQHDFVGDLSNGGQDVGKIDKRVPKSLIAKMNALKPQIVSGKIKIPVKL
jgi:basic membrane protein A and related proteins